MRIGKMKPAAAGLALALAGSVFAHGPGVPPSSAQVTSAVATSQPRSEFVQTTAANQARSLDDLQTPHTSAMTSPEIWGLSKAESVEEWPHRGTGGFTPHRVAAAETRVVPMSAEVPAAGQPASPATPADPYVPEDYHSHLREMQAWEKSLLPQQSTAGTTPQGQPQSAAASASRPVVRPQFNTTPRTAHGATAARQIPADWAPRPTARKSTSRTAARPQTEAPIETVANVVPPAPGPSGQPGQESSSAAAPIADLPDFSSTIDDDSQLAAMPYQAPVYTRRGKKRLLTNPAEPRDPADSCKDCWVSQLFPDGLLYKSYLAGEKEPRMGLSQLAISGGNTVWEAALGGRVGLWRLGTPGAVRPEGWQIDLEGAALARVDKDENSDLDAADFRFGVPLTYRRGATAYKFGYYHLSSHVGDEYLLKHPTFRRRNYVRDAVLLGISHDFTLDLRGYAEVAYAPAASGGAEPLEFQFGGEYSPARSNGGKGDPFAAVNIHLREEFNFGGSVNVMTGWQWRGPLTDRLFRVGVQYYNGKSMQYSFFDEHEELIGAGMWFDY